MADEPEARGLAARTGIAALNLVAPGLGLIRLGRLRAGLIFLVAPFAITVTLFAIAAVAPIMSFTAFAIVTVLLIGAVVGIYVAPIAIGWPSSRAVGRMAPWSKWYMMAALAVLALLLTNLGVMAVHSIYKPFYVPSESMMPTINVGDRFMVDMKGGRAPGRGDIIIFNSHDGVRIARVAALGGDTVALRNGVPMVNGAAAARRIVGNEKVNWIGETVVATRISERLPGEAGTHFVLDSGQSPGDEFPATRVPDGRLFLLGDNRDNAADSRFSKEVYGVEMVPVSDVLGRPLFIYRSRDRGSVGTKLSR